MVGNLRRNWRRLFVTGVRLLGGPRGRAGLFARDDAGALAATFGVLVVAIVAAAGVAVDYTRAATVQEDLQRASDKALKAVAWYAQEGAVDNTNVQAVAQQYLERNFKNADATGAPRVLSITMDPVNKVYRIEATVGYSSLFSTVTGVAGSTAGALAEIQGDVNEVPPPPESYCVAPPPETRTVEETLACPGGEVGKQVVEQQQRRTASCSNPLGQPVWGGWTNVGAPTEMSNSCSAACAPQPDQTRWVAGSNACPSGQSGSTTFEKEQKRSSSCNASNQLVWSAYADTGATRNQVSTCSTACTPAAAETRWTSEVGECSGGLFGSVTWQAEERRTSSCPSATGSPVWASWTKTGATRNRTESCSASCTPQAAQTRWTAVSAACPANEVGANNWERQERRTSSCSAANKLVWTDWTATGETRNVENTCEAKCTVEPAQKRWVADSERCPSGQVGSVDWEKEQERTSSCNAANKLVWSSYSDTGRTRDRVNSCKRECVPNGIETRWQFTNGGCPAGYIGTDTWESEQERASTCPSSTGNPVWGSWVDTGRTRNRERDCKLACKPNGSERRWVATTGSCPSGWNGTKTWDREQERTSYCPAATGNPAWTSWTDTGRTRSVVDRCTRPDRPASTHFIRWSVRYYKVNPASGPWATEEPMDKLMAQERSVHSQMDQFVSSNKGNWGAWSRIKVVSNLCGEAGDTKDCWTRLVGPNGDYIRYLYMCTIGNAGPEGVRNGRCLYWVQPETAAPSLFFLYDMVEYCPAGYDRIVPWSYNKNENNSGGVCKDAP